MTTLFSAPVSESLANIRVILVETSHTGNIGSAARAMKTMGLTQLYLVNPLIKPDSQAIAMAAGAGDIIHQATIVEHLDQALENCVLVLGTSARSRTLQWPTLSPRECGVKAIDEAQHGNIALVFGRERVGLTNDELQKCHYHIAIPANPDYSSLNLAMAVQILAYELRMAALTRQPELPLLSPPHESYPVAEDLARFYQHLEQVLLRVEFIRQAHPGQVVNRLRRLFTRSRLESQELNILRGILSAIETTLNKSTQERTK